MHSRLLVAVSPAADGVIFVSIDDNEVTNLRRLMEEVFGEENFVANLVWQKSKRGDAKLIARTHEYMLVFVKDKEHALDNGVWRRKKPGAEEVLAKYAEIRARLGEEAHEAIQGEMRTWYSSLLKADPRRSHQHYRGSDKRGLYFADNFAGPDDGRESRPRYDIIHPVAASHAPSPRLAGVGKKPQHRKHSLTIRHEFTLALMRRPFLAGKPTSPKCSQNRMHPSFTATDEVQHLRSSRLSGKACLSSPRTKKFLETCLRSPRIQTTSSSTSSAGAGRRHRR